MNDCREAPASDASPHPPPIALVRLSADHADPITVHFVDATIEVMLVLRESIPGRAGRISQDTWGVAGVYVLLGPAARGVALVRTRPGSSHDVLARLRQHRAESPWFTRALAARDTRQGWNFAEVGYLEGRLHNLCRASSGVEHDFRRDEDRTLQHHEKELLDHRYLPPIIAALHLAGVPIEVSSK